MIEDASWMTQAHVSAAAMIETMRAPLPVFGRTIDLGRLLLPGAVVALVEAEDGGQLAEEMLREFPALRHVYVVVNGNDDAFSSTWCRLQWHAARSSLLRLAQQRAAMLFPRAFFDMVYLHRQLPLSSMHAWCDLIRPGGFVAGVQRDEWEADIYALCSHPGLQRQIMARPSRASAPPVWLAQRGVRYRGIANGHGRGTADDRRTDADPRVL